MTWSGTLYEHEVVANKSGDGWDWSCSSCGERGHSATVYDHWIDIVEAGIQQTRRETAWEFSLEARASCRGNLGRRSV